MPSSTSRDKLVFLHVSDIHLKKEEIASSQDVDHDIRAKLRQDLEGGAVPITDGVDGILVTGDISYKADPIEFESAHEWLADLCALLKCDASSVWVVPGNHDVNRSTIKRSQTIQDIHSAIRAEGDRSEGLRRRLQDATAAQNLVIAFQEYNAFAERYSSDSRATSAFWESAPDDFRLNDGSVLRLRGLNSVLISDDNDKSGPPSQVLGLRQVQLNDEPGVVYLTMCHHPLDWLYDHDQAEDYLFSRASIALFGHKHRQRAHTHDQCLIIGAGALHPDRGELPWEPRYNLFEVSVGGTGADRKLKVSVYQREWKAKDTCFGSMVGADATYPKEFTLSLRPWEAKIPSPASATNHANTPQQVPQAPQDAEREAAGMLSPRQAVYRFLSLSYPTRMNILVGLGLLLEGDEKRSDGEMIRVAIERARERGILDRLEMEITTAAQKD